MSDNESAAVKASSWKLAPEILAMLKAIATDEGESQATMLRDMIKKEFKRRKLKLPE